jgi:hypothetical protein
MCARVCNDSNTFVYLKYPIKILEVCFSLIMTHKIRHNKFSFFNIYTRIFIVEISDNLNEFFFQIFVKGGM